MTRLRQTLSVTATLSLLVVGISGCDIFKESLSKTVYIQYDQALNFRVLDFGVTPIITTPDGNKTSIRQIYAADNDSYVGGMSGVFMTFVICKISNVSEKAEGFPYDTSKFYVDVNGKRFYTGVIEPNTLTYGSNPARVDQFLADAIEKQLRDSTQVGGTDTISANQEVYPYFRFTIYVALPVPPYFDRKTLTAKLMYDSKYSHFMDPTNQPPVFADTTTPSSLPTRCRPKAA